MAKSKIIFVHLFNSFSGSPKVLESTIEVLRKDRDCILLMNDTEGFLDNVDIKKVRFRFRLSANKLVTLFSFTIAQFNLFFHTLRLANKEDIIYINTTIPIFAALAGRFKRSKVVFHLHEDRNSLNVIHRCLSSLRRYCCDYEIFVSNYLYSKEHISGKKYSVVPNALSNEFVANAVNNCPKRLESDLFKVLMVCSLKKYKGVFELLDICNHLLSEQLIQFHLVVSEDSKAIEEYFGNYQIPNNLIVHPKTNDIAAHFLDASLLLNLSRPNEWVETFGLTILEGMIYGLPCIVPPVGGPVELVLDDVNGFTRSGYQTMEIADLILLLHKDKFLYQRMSIKSKELAHNFSFTRFENNLKQLMENL